jgi:hypothetical protein
MFAMRLLQQGRRLKEWVSTVLLHCGRLQPRMSALGQKLPRRDQIVMSALPPKAAAAVADRRGS